MYYTQQNVVSLKKIFLPWLEMTGTVNSYPLMAMKKVCKDLSAQFLHQ